MAKNEPTELDADSGGTPIDCTSETCCPSRNGEREISGNFSRIFQEYGRSTTSFTSPSAVRANLPGGVTWEKYYYRGTYKYHLGYESSPGSKGKLIGKLTVTIRARATPHSVPGHLRAAAPTHFQPVTPAIIAAAFSGWNTSVQNHWTKTRYHILVGAPDCPADYQVFFVLTQVTSASSSHRNFTVLNQSATEADPTWRAILANPAHPRYATAQELKREARSNAAKFNLGDSRGNLVFAHEYGHWIGWGDEYIEGSMINSASSPTGQLYSEKRNNRWGPVRVAIRFVNPTRNFQSAHGTDKETVDITVRGSKNWLMSSMASPQTHLPRFIYTIVDDFMRIYNKDHYGGGNSAYCIDVKA